MKTRAKFFHMKLADANQYKSADGKTLSVKGYFTSDRKDMVGDIITRTATEKAVPEYRQWGNIRYMHQPRPVGVVTAIGSDDDLEWNEVEFNVTKADVIDDIDQGLLKALSVGILIDWEDIDFLEDGGWIINGYKLAEISLVDHPANYDAKLKDMTGNDAIQHVVRSYSVGGTLPRTPAQLTEENEMPKEKEIVVEEEVIEDTATVTEETPVEKTVDEEVVVEETVDEVDSDETEEVVEKEIVADEEETVDEIEEEPVEKFIGDEEDEVAEEELVEKDITDDEETIVVGEIEVPAWAQEMSDSLKALGSEIKTVVEDVAKLALNITEVDAEAEIEQAIDSDEDETEDEELPELIDTEKQKGAMPATEIIETSEELTVEPETPQTLRTVLGKLFKEDQI